MRQLASYEIYQRQRRANPGSMHWENRERSKKSTGEVIF
jgi:hypothetical protein